MNNAGLLILALVAASSSAMSQQITGAGGQIQQLPPVPAPQKSVPDIRVAPRAARPSADVDGVAVRIDTLRITGQTRYSEQALIAVTQFRPGAILTLSDLRRMAARISDFYNAQGYFVAQAYLPAQTSAAGTVMIAVVEGRYDQVRLNNRSRLSSGVARRVLSGLDRGDVVRSAPLERRLLLLSDNPGVAVRSTLSPGGPTGTSDLTVDVTPGPGLSGDLEADNAGNRYTGLYRGGGTLNLNEPLGIGDVASVRVLTSGSGLNYVRGAYQAPVGDLTLGVAYASFWYRLGREFSGLHADGRAQIASAFASYPLFRSRNDSLYALADVDYRTFHDHIGLTGAVTDKRAEVATVGLSGNHHDAFGGGGSDTYSIYGSVGHLDIQSPEARTSDAATARTNGDYQKLYVSVDRSQTLAGPLSLYGLFRGQIASKNLDISEKMELGGAYGVRAYPEGEAYGDEGYIVTGEARLALPKPDDAFPGRFQAFGFVDRGWVRFERTPWLPGVNSTTRTGAGAGITWSKAGDVYVTALYAFEIGDVRATSAPDHGGTFRFQVVKFF